MHIWWRQTTWVVLVPPPLHTYQVLQKSVIAFSLEKRRFTFDVDKKPTSVHTSVQTVWQLQSKWSFQHSWQPTKTGKASCKMIFDMNMLKASICSFESVSDLFAKQISKRIGRPLPMPLFLCDFCAFSVFLSKKKKWKIKKMCRTWQFLDVLLETQVFFFFFLALLWYSKGWKEGT